MKFLDKVGLVFFSIIVLTLSILLFLVGFGWLDPAIFSVLVGKALVSETSTYVMIGVSVVLILLAIRCLFFSDMSSEKKKNEGILMQNEDGKLIITKDTLINLAESVIKDFPSILSSDSEVIIENENDISINIDIEVQDDVVIKNITSKLQTEVKKKIKASTDLELKAVNVNIKKVEPKQEPEEKETEKQERDA